MNLLELKLVLEDKPEVHKHIHESFIEKVNADPVLKEHRDYVETNIFGFGERSFHWLWKILLDELPETPTLLEIGCFRGQILSLWSILKPQASIFGITPLDTSGDVWQSDYAADIKKIHDDFKLEQPFIYHGRSDNPEIIKTASNLLYDVVYLDGDHTYVGVMNDLTHYAPLVKPGGYLVMDDCCCDMQMEFGFFQGIKEVNEAFADYMKDNGDKWEFMVSVVHLRVMKRV